MSPFLVVLTTILAIVSYSICYNAVTNSANQFIGDTSSTRMEVERLVKLVTEFDNRDVSGRILMLTCMNSILLITIIAVGVISLIVVVQRNYIYRDHLIKIINNSEQRLSDRIKALQQSSNDIEKDIAV